MRRTERLRPIVPAVLLLLFLCAGHLSFELALRVAALPRSGFAQAAPYGEAPGGGAPTWPVLVVLSAFALAIAPLPASDRRWRRVAAAALAVGFALPASTLLAHFAVQTAQLAHGLASWSLTANASHPGGPLIIPSEMLGAAARGLACASVALAACCTLPSVRASAGGRANLGAALIWTGAAALTATLAQADASGCFASWPGRTATTDHWNGLGFENAAFWCAVAGALTSLAARQLARALSLPMLAAAALLVLAVSYWANGGAFAGAIECGRLELPQRALTVPVIARPLGTPLPAGEEPSYVVQVNEHDFMFAGARYTSANELAPSLRRLLDEQRRLTKADSEPRLLWLRAAAQAPTSRIASAARVARELGFSGIALELGLEHSAKIGPGTRLNGLTLLRQSFWFRRTCVCPATLESGLSVGAWLNGASDCARSTVGCLEDPGGP